MRLALVCLVAACALEKRPPTALVRTGQAVPVRRVVVLPSECTSTLCKGLDQLVAGELTFRGYEVVDLERLAAVERTRIEIHTTWSSTDGGVERAGAEHTVEVRGATLSDLDTWALRRELAAIGVDAVVHVRAAEILAAPRRVAALVRVTRAADAGLVLAAACEVEVDDGFTVLERGAESALRCALAQLPR